MGPAEYLLTFLGIVLALGIQELLQGFGRVVRDRALRQPPVAHYVFGISVVLLTVSYWWNGWDWRGVREWTLLDFLLMLLALTSFYLLAHLAFPEKGSDNYRSYYYDSSGRLWGLLAAFSLFSQLSTASVFDWGFPPWTWIPFVVLGSVAVLSKLTRSPLFHLGISIALLALTLLQLSGAQPLVVEVENILQGSF